MYTCSFYTHQKTCLKGSFWSQYVGYTYTSLSICPNS